MSLRVEQGDITRFEGDAIVNAANEAMLGGGGVDGAIHRVAGPQLLDACRAVPEVAPGVRCPTGECRITPAFLLPVKYVIHTVGPVYRGGQAGEATQLRSCYTSAMQMARDYRLRSIAFPAISCGVFGYPVNEAAHIAVAAIREAVAAIREELGAAAARNAPGSSNSPPADELEVVLMAFDEGTFQVLDQVCRQVCQETGADGVGH